MKKLLTIAVLAIGMASVKAEEAGFQASLIPDIALHSRTTTIRGVSLNIWGENPQHGVALGFVNGSTGDSEGLSWGFIASYAESYAGVQWGLINISTDEFVGWQGGCVNYSKGLFKGLQSGFLNYAEGFTGLQLGVLNYAENLHGVQIGLLNVAKNNSWFTECPDKLATVFPIVNWSF